MTEQKIARFVAYLDYLLKNSSTPRRMMIDWAKCDEDERQQVFTWASEGKLEKGESRGEYYIASREVYDEWQDLLWRYYVDHSGTRGVAK